VIENQKTLDIPSLFVRCLF